MATNLENVRILGISKVFIKEASFFGGEKKSRKNDRKTLGFCPKSQGVCANTQGNQKIPQRFSKMSNQNRIFFLQKKDFLEARIIFAEKTPKNQKYSIFNK